MPSNSPVNTGEQTNSALPHATVQPVQYISTVHDNDYVYRPEDHVFDRHRGETPVLTDDFAGAGEHKEPSSAKGPVNVDTPANKTNGYGVLQSDFYEHPSAKPRPLRRVSGYSSSRSSSGRSLRDLYHKAGGLGIELSDNSNAYAHDNGTTLGVDGDSNFERRRDMVSMRSPDFYVKQAAFDGNSQRHESKEHKFQSHPIESTKYMIDAVHSRHKKEMQTTIDLLDGKIERLISVQSRFEGVLTSTRDSVDQVIAEQRKIREIMDAMLFEDRKTREQIEDMLVKDRKTSETIDMLIANHHVVRDTLQTIVVDTRLLQDFSADIRLIHNVAGDARLIHNVAANTRSIQAEIRKMHQSIADQAEHAFDNEKFDLLVDKVVERLHPTIVWAMEKGDRNTEHILAHLNQGRERKQLMNHDQVAGQTTTNDCSSPTNGVHYAPSSSLHFSPSANGPFAAHNNEYFSTPTHHFRNRNGSSKYSEDPSQR